MLSSVSSLVYIIIYSIMQEYGHTAYLAFASTRRHGNRPKRHYSNLF